MRILWIQLITWCLTNHSQVLK